MSATNTDFVADKYHGVYPQKQEGQFMQRIKVVAGRITWGQWRSVAKLCRRYSPGTAIHLTTRQDIELHNLSAEGAIDVQRELDEVGLTTIGAGGDSIRNITACSGCSLDADSGDVATLAKAVDSYLRDLTFDLGRKFKISFSGCSVGCGKPWLNDLAFVRQSDHTFTVIGAGSLGAKPALGIELYRDFQAGDILPLCVAALEFFAEHGDRENRNRARFRHVREKFGDEAFKKELAVRFEGAKKSQSWPDVELPARTTYRESQLLWKLQLPDGNISADEAIELAEIADSAGSELRINLEHGLELYGGTRFELPGHLAELEGRPIVIACPGTSTCTKGLADCRAAAEAIRKAFEGEDASDVRICISGCPNNCVHSAAAQIGLVGIKRKQGDEVIECYRVFTGGDNGRSDRLAEKGNIIARGDIAGYIQDVLVR